MNKIDLLKIKNLSLTLIKINLIITKVNLDFLFEIFGIMDKMVANLKHFY